MKRDVATAPAAEALALFRAEVARWANRLKVRPRQIRVQRMVRKWGSCSSSGTVSFATELIRESQQFREYVIVHELLHLRVRNHGSLFRSYLGAYVPGWQRHVRRTETGPRCSQDRGTMGRQRA